MGQPGIEELFEAAMLCHRNGQLSDAERLYREILSRDAAHAEAMHFLGVIALQTGHAEPARELIEASIRLRPDDAVYHNNLGQVFERLQRNTDAQQAYEDAIAHDSANAEAWNNLGRILENRHDTVSAAEHYRKAIELQPDYADPHTNLGNVFKARGEIEAAIAAWREAMRINPAQAFVHSNLLLALHYLEDSTPESLLREHETWAQLHAAPLTAAVQAHQNNPDPDRRLRVGYVSPDFRAHAVARFLLPVLARHDAAQFEIFGYSDTHRTDDVTAAIRGYCAHWREVHAHDDAQLAEQIVADEIDVLVDLAAHSGRNRLLSFARKPAPVQMTWLAYCSTTGMQAMDYRLTDRWLDSPQAAASEYAETSVFLPGSYWCYSAPAQASGEYAPPRVTDTPVTFGCLNNFAKVTPATIQMWAEILRQLPDAQLLLYAPDATVHNNVREALGLASTDHGRIEFVGQQPFDEYLQTYRHIDVALDPFPYGGGTTSCDALWMGVPVVTRAGSTAVSRAGRSLLNNLGHPEWITDGATHYVETATRLARNPRTLEALRRELRPQLRASVIMDAARHTQDIEAAYRDTWQRWCARQDANNQTV